MLNGGRKNPQIQSTLHLNRGRDLVPRSFAALRSNGSRRLDLRRTRSLALDFASPGFCHLQHRIVRARECSPRSQVEPARTVPTGHNPRACLESTQAIARELCDGIPVAAHHLRNASNRSSLKERYDPTLETRYPTRRIRGRRTEIVRPSAEVPNLP
jgi:hypothetical protein